MDEIGGAGMKRPLSPPPEPKAKRRIAPIPLPAAEPNGAPGAGGAESAAPSSAWQATPARAAASAEQPKGSGTTDTATPDAEMPDAISNPDENAAPGSDSDISEDDDEKAETARHARLYHMSADQIEEELIWGEGGLVEAQEAMDHFALMLEDGKPDRKLGEVRPAVAMSTGDPPRPH